MLRALKKSTFVRVEIYAQNDYQFNGEANFDTQIASRTRIILKYGVLATYAYSGEVIIEARYKRLCLVLTIM